MDRSKLWDLSEIFLYNYVLVPAICIGFDNLFDRASVLHLDFESHYCLFLCYNLSWIPDNCVW